jgi:septal ring factor EnvC (AmiA/AmiB activator)
MSTTSPQPDAAPAAPTKHRNWWIWVSAAVGLLALGLLVWALTLRSDLAGTQSELDTATQELASTGQELETVQQELDSTTRQLDDATPPATPTPAAVPDDEGNGQTAALVAAGALFTGLARELGASREDVEQTEEELADAQKEADDAELEASAAKRQVDAATDEADKANAQANQANAERDAAQAKATIAAECARAYIGAFGALFGSGKVREQLPAVRKDLEGITAECKTAISGS